MLPYLTALPTSTFHKCVSTPGSKRLPSGLPPLSFAIMAARNAAGIAVPATAASIAAPNFARIVCMSCCSTPPLVIEHLGEQIYTDGDRRDDPDADHGRIAGRGRNRPGRRLIGRRGDRIGRGRPARGAP